MSIARCLERGAAILDFTLAPGTAAESAAAAIAGTLLRLAPRLPRPGVLFASGGETLRALCRAVGADHLELCGQLMPGVPISLLRGGRWTGVPLLSKSGAFGPPQLLSRLFIWLLRTVEGRGEFCNILAEPAPSRGAEP